MFEQPPLRRTRPLLMQDAANDADPSSPAVADTHKKARKQRMARGRKPLTSLFVDEENKTEDSPAHANHGQDSKIMPDPAPGHTNVSDNRPEFIIANSNDGNGATQPLIDPVIVLTTLWKWRWPIAGLTLCGGVLGVLLALASPKHYTAYSSVLIDPREIKLVERDLTPEFLASEAALAIIDSRLQLATSRPVLERVIERNKLTQDAEFNGEGSGAVGAMGVITGLLFGGSEVPGGRTRTTLETLRNNITVERATRTFIVNIGATSQSSEKAALLANEVAQSFIEQQSDIRTDSARDASVALSGRLSQLRGAVEEAESRVETFRAANDLVNAQGQLISEEELGAVNASLTAAKSATIEAKSKADAARSADVNAVVSGVLPTALVTPALTTFRAQFASLKQQLASLETQLGPRHPRLANVRASVDAAASDIRTELRRIVAGTQADLRSAIQTEQQIAQRLAQLKARSANNSDAIIELRELEREATAARTIYETALTRSRETGEMEAVNAANARIVSEAEPPLTSSSTSRKLVVIGSALAGFALGTALALASGIAKSLKTSLNRPQQSGHIPQNRTPMHPSGPSGGRRGEDESDENTRTQKPANSETDMYSPYPYPYPQHQPAAANGAPQVGSPQYPYPQAMPQPAWPQQPAPFAGHAMAPQPPHFPPMAQHGPYSGYAPMPQQSYAQPQIQPVFLPIMQQPTPAAAPVHEPGPVRSRDDDDRRRRDEEEMDDLRQSVRDLRDVVDALASRRYG